MSDDCQEPLNTKAEDAANRLTMGLNGAHDALMNGLNTRDVEHLIRIISRAHDALHMNDGLRRAIVDEDASCVCARADEVVATVHGIFLTAERLLKRAEDIRLASADFRNAVELAGDESY